MALFIYFLRVYIVIGPPICAADKISLTGFYSPGLGYFAVNSLNLGSRTDLFGQLWKEYALSDSRYMTQDAFVVCMESVTACLWGPLSFLCAYYIILDHPLRYPVQLMVSFGQLYGLVLYYGTAMFEDLVHGVQLSRPERIYFYAYYVACNAFWIFIPIWLIYESVCKTSAAFTKTKKADTLRESRRNGYTNGSIKA